MIRGTYLGIESAKRGILAAQAALDTVSHNIANANTEGFSRQRVIQTATWPLPIPGILQGAGAGQQGTGVYVKSIERIRSMFLEGVFRGENGVGGENEAIRSGLERLDGIFSEPGDRGFSATLEDFFNAWEILSNDPEGTSARANLRAVSETLINTVKDIDARFDEEVRRINDLILTRVSEINSMTQQIAELNESIASIEAGENQKANDLRDRRDLLVSRLSRLININVHEDMLGNYTVSVAGHPLVQERYTTNIIAFTDVTPYGAVIGIRLETGLPVDLRSGELRGLFHLRDEVIPEVRHDFNVAVSAVVNQVNALHREGFGLDGKTRRDFFVDYVTREIRGLNAVPSATGLDTTLFDLGISSGDFFIGDKRIVITDDEIKPGSETTLRDILERIFNATSGRIQGEIVFESGADVVALMLHNPPEAVGAGSEGVFESTINAKSGTSTFLVALGLLPENEKEITTDPPYINIAKALRLNPLIARDLDIIAAAAGTVDRQFSGPGDNRLALAIADLKNARDFVDGDSIFGYYRGAIVKLGAGVQEATRLNLNQDFVVEQIEKRRESISGVSLDEEAVKMIIHQRALQASARMITSLDEVLDRLINRMGIVGR